MKTVELLRLACKLADRSAHNHSATMVIVSRSNWESLVQLLHAALAAAETRK